MVADFKTRMAPLGSSLLKSAAFALSNPAVGPPEQDGADRLKEKIRDPENQIGTPVGPRRQRLTEDEKAIIDQHQKQRHGDPEGGLAPMSANAKRNADQGKADAGE